MDAENWQERKSVEREPAGCDSKNNELEMYYQPLNRNHARAMPRGRGTCGGGIGRAFGMVAPG